MRHRITIFAVAAALSLSLGMVAPAQAWPGGAPGTRPAAGWWQATIDTLATLFGLDRPAASPKGPKRDGSACIDPNGNPVCPAPQPTLQVDGSCSIDPGGNPVCPAPQPTRLDGSCGIDPLGNPVCRPGS